MWNQHHADFESSCEINPLRLELFGLAKPYFREEQFLVAEDDTGAVLGFLHFGPTGNADLSDVNPTTLCISALCVTPSAQENLVAAQLLAQLLKYAHLHNVKNCFFRPPIPHSAFYLGLGPADSMLGATSQEIRVCGWLAHAGFLPKSPTCMWELELIKLSLPIDRMQIQIRRTATVNQQLDEPVLPWWQACVLGHTEPTAFQLTHRTEKRVLCEILYWTLSPELQSSAASMVWLWPLETDGNPQERDYLTFLLAESLRQYQTDRIAYVRTASLASNQSASDILQRLGFHPIYNGMVFETNIQ